MIFGESTIKTLLVLGNIIQKIKTKKKHNYSYVGSFEIFLKQSNNSPVGPSKIFFKKSPALSPFDRIHKKITITALLMA